MLSSGGVVRDAFLEELVPELHPQTNRYWGKSVKLEAGGAR